MITWHPPWKQATLGGMPPQEYTQPGNKALHWMAQGYVHCSTHWVKLCTGCERAQPKMVSSWQRAFDAQSLTLKPCEQREPQMLPRPAHPSVPADCAAHREGAGDAHPHCSPSTCNHKVAGNQMSCRFGDMGPARNTADLWEQVYSQKLKCMW